MSTELESERQRGAAGGCVLACWYVRRRAEIFCPPKNWVESGAVFRNSRYASQICGSGSGREHRQRQQLTSLASLRYSSHKSELI